MSSSNVYLDISEFITHFVWPLTMQLCTLIDRVQKLFMCFSNCASSVQEWDVSFVIFHASMAFIFIYCRQISVALKLIALPILQSQKVYCILLYICHIVAWFA